MSPPIRNRIDNNFDVIWLTNIIIWESDTISEEAWLESAESVVLVLNR